MKNKKTTPPKSLNTITGTGTGSLPLSIEKVSAKYLLLHTHKDKESNKLWKIVSKGPKVWSKQNLVRKNYPSDPSEDFYLVIELEEVDAPELENISWDFKKLKNYKGGHGSGKPFVATLAELMKNKIE